MSRASKRRCPQHERDAPVAEPEGRTIDVPGGAIHEWRGSILVPRHDGGAARRRAAQSGTRRRCRRMSLESRVLERHGDSLRMYLKLVRKLIVTVTYDTEHDVRYVRRSPTFATSRSVATQIVEAGGGDRGFLWRLNSYWRYRQVGDAVQVDVLSLSLSRDVPWSSGRSRSRSSTASGANRCRGRSTPSTRGEDAAVPNRRRSRLAERLDSDPGRFEARLAARAASRSAPAVSPWMQIVSTSSGSVDPSTADHRPLGRHSNRAADDLLDIDESPRRVSVLRRPAIPSGS